MTPAILIVRDAAVTHQVHSYAHDASVAAYGLEAAEKLGVAPQRVFKTLVVRSDRGTLATALVPVGSKLSLKHLARRLGAKKIEMAEAAQVERVTGYVLGGVSPLGQKKHLPTVIDASALRYPTIYVSAGRRGLELELAPVDLQRLTGAVIAELSA